MPALKNARHEREPAPAGFYVYELIDPRTGATFYVGKGKDRRAWSHEVAERLGNERNGLKAEVLGQLRRAGQRAIVRIVRDGLNESDALRLERSMIVRNHAALTNIAMGNRSAMEVVRAQAREGLAQIKPLCALLRMNPTALQRRVWVECVTNLARYSTLPG